MGTLPHTRTLIDQEVDALASPVHAKASAHLANFADLQRTRLALMLSNAVPRESR